MRVVAGKYKGHRLHGPRSGATRATGDRVREAVFSILGDIEGARVLDLFAGTGALGIEALSRGAAHVTFVEMDRRALEVLGRNLDDVIRPDRHESLNPARVLRGDVHDHLARFHTTSERFDIVFLDPPYADADRHAPGLAKGLPGVLAPGAVVVAECDRRTPLRLEDHARDEAQEALPQVDERRYGDTLIRILRYPTRDAGELTA